jgi:hypothetical protein
MAWELLPRRRVAGERRRRRCRFCGAFEYDVPINQEKTMTFLRGIARRALVFMGLLVGSWAASSGLRAQTLQPISVIVFPGGFNWPIWVAQQKGYFAQNGIEVKLTNTPNSVFQLTGLIEGRFDIAMTAIDNVVAYMEGQGEADVKRQPDISPSWEATTVFSAWSRFQRSRPTPISKAARFRSML